MQELQSKGTEVVHTSSAHPDAFREAKQFQEANKGH